MLGDLYRAATGSPVGLLLVLLAAKLWCEGHVDRVKAAWRMWRQK